jgi:tripeptide aminopeptidase
MGLEVEADEAGNLLARVRGRSERTVLLCAHLDTVPPVAPIEPVLVDDGWENANAGILGADNKSAVAMILALARRCSVEGSPVGLELLFTVAEEVGLQGAKRFDASRLRAEFGYVFDHATAIGELVTASPTLYRVEAEFHGKSAHAGLRPEAGRSAILAAAHAAIAMPHGRIDEQTTANLGFLHGGVESTNVVPERARVLAEVRSVDPDRAEEVLAAMIDALHDGASHGECDVDVITEKQVVGYRSKPSSPVVVAAEAALRAHGYEPTRIATGGASDANALEAAGVPCVNLANGTERNHEPGERVSVAALEGMLDVALALLDEAAAVPLP